MQPSAEHRALVLEHAIRRGSSWPLVVTTGSGRYVVKLRGAGQGTAALVSEWIVAGLADLLGLRVPRRALIRIDAGLVREDRDQELADLVRASWAKTSASSGWKEPASSTPPRSHASTRIWPHAPRGSTRSSKTWIARRRTPICSRTLARSG